MASSACPYCNGSSYIDGVLCRDCLGTGSLPIAKRGIEIEKLLIDDLVPVGVFQAYAVLECLDATEHNALTDTQKDGVLHLLACGRVDLNDGKAGKVRLWNWFGAESTTVANLTALIG